MKNAWLVCLLVLTSAGRAEAQGSPPIIPGNVAQYSTVNLPFCGPGTWNHEGLIAYDTGRHCAVWCDGSTWACLESDGGFVPIYSPDASTGLTVTGGDTMYLQAAGPTTPGALTTGAQTIPGDKTFANKVTIDGGFSILSDQAQSNVPLATTAALALYVDPAGADTNACTASGASACLTIQGAVNKVPKLIRHAVTITVASGTYAGAFIEGFTFAGGVTGASFSITGTLITATPTTGSATGTATGGAAGVSQTFATLTDSGAAWTTDDLRGKLLTTVGTGAGTYMISSNTATTITVASQTAPAAAGTTYTIQDWGSNLNSDVAYPVSPNGAAALRSVLFVEVSGNPTGDTLLLKNLKITNPSTSSTAMRLHGGGSMVLFQSKIQGINAAAATVEFQRFSGSFSSVVAGWACQTTSCILATTPSSVVSVGSVLGAGGARSAMRVLLDIEHTVMDSGTGVINMRAGGIRINASSLKMTTSSNSLVAVGSSVDLLFIQSSRLDCTTSSDSAAIFEVSNGSWPNTLVNVAPSPVVALNGVDISNCTRAINLVGPTMFSATASAAANTGSGNGTVLWLNAGAQALWNASNTMTGTTEIVLDGDTFTFAQMRALNPAAITNLTYGTKVFQ